MNLEDFEDSSIQVLLTVRAFDLRKERDLPDDFHREAWFRLQNETTNQTLDYTMIRKIDLPEDYNEGNVEEEDPSIDPEERKIRNELVYLAGRIYCEVDKKTGNRKWIYEKWNKIV